MMTVRGRNGKLDIVVRDERMYYRIIQEKRGEYMQYRAQTSRDKNEWHDVDGTLANSADQSERLLHDKHYIRVVREGRL